MAEQSVKETVPEISAEPEKSTRDQSTIKFAYQSLDEAIEMATGVHAIAGTSCTVDQLAAHMNLKPDTGSFRVKIANAKLFGLITHSAGTVTLTALGSRICDPQQEQAARAEAFLNVPLYRAIYEQFRGGSLPPPAGLEAAMVTLGVVTKQKAVARQVFVRSATQAGFFAFGPNRLVMPAIRGGGGGSVAVEAPVAPELTRDIPKKNGGGDGGDYHPFIAGLLKTLPPADSDWPMDSRRKWLQAASHIFELIYKDSESKGSLRIEVQKDSGK
jgi:hypothetical protein